MSVAPEIKQIELEDEFRACPVCNYDMGFHVSFNRKSGQQFDIILICPQCGARFAINWDVKLDKS